MKLKSSRGSSLIGKSKCDILRNIEKKILKNNQFSPNAISHKELNILLNRAQKANSLNNTSKENENIENKEFNDLVSNWAKTSQEILSILNKNDKMVNKNRNSKSLIAFGAMGAHINMALQALKATESDQQ